MNCPKCEASVPANATECPACGVFLAKAAAPRPPRRFQSAAPAPPQPSAKSTASPAAVLLRIAIIAIGLWIGWTLVGGKKVAVAGTWYQGADGFERAKLDQKNSQRPILLYFYTTWCGYCKRLDRDVLSTAKFESDYSGVIKVKVNPERDGGGAAALAARYEVRGFPTVYVVPAQGRPSAMVGYGGADGFYSFLNDATR